MGTIMTVLPDVIARDLDVVFCGSAAGAESARQKAYYAGPGNKFWSNLHKIGLTDRELKPAEYLLVLTYGIGLTDMNKHESGSDGDLAQAADDPSRLRQIVTVQRPKFLAFNGKRAAKVFFGGDVNYGRQAETIGETAIYVLPSTSGAASGHWDFALWQEFAEHVRQRRLFARDEPALDDLTPEAREDMRVSLNRRLYHRIGLDLRKKRDESEFASRMTSANQIRRLKSIAERTAAAFLEGPAAFLNLPSAGLDALVDDFFALYPERPVQDNEGGTKFCDSFWLYVLTRLFAPDFVVESGVHRGHSTWILHTASPRAALHCFDVSFRNLVWREARAAYHENDWMLDGPTAPDRGRSLCYFDDHISHAQRIVEAHARGFRTLLFDDDFAAHHLHGTGHPPLPTLAMLMDEDLEDGETITWLRHGKEKTWTVDVAAQSSARALISHYAKTPDLGPLLRLRPQSGIAVVRLKD
jgi:TDG/mug DNA glycosylase family protein